MTNHNRFIALAQPLLVQCATSCWNLSSRWCLASLKTNFLLITSNVYSYHLFHFWSEMYCYNLNFKTINRGKRYYKFRKIRQGDIESNYFQIVGKQHWWSTNKKCHLHKVRVKGKIQKSTEIFGQCVDSSSQKPITRYFHFFTKYAKSCSVTLKSKLLWLIVLGLM